jgi:hypothetical protein
MKTRLLLPLLFVSTVAQADIVHDRQAVNACENRFDRVNRSEELNLRQGPIYTAKSPVGGVYQYYFNASNGEKTYRVECQAKRIGKVVEFALEPGRWVFENSVNEGVAAY